MFASTNTIKLAALLLATVQFIAPATAANVTPRGVDGAVELGSFSKRDTPKAGCGAFGPLTDSPWGTIEDFCKPGEKWTCEVKDETGCAAGDASHVASLTIVDSINRQDLAGGGGQTSTTGVCTENVRIKCVLQLDNASSGAKYSMIFKKSS